MIGASDSAWPRAFVVCALRALAVSSAVPARPRKPPSFLPRALAAASALRVRSPIMPASSSATLAICCNRNRPVAPFDGRHVDEANLDVCGEELRQEGDAAREPRDVGDDERCAVRSA